MGIFRVRINAVCDVLFPLHSLLGHHVVFTIGYGKKKSFKDTGLADN